MKRVGQRSYVHRSALHQLPVRDQARVLALAVRAPSFPWTVARIGPNNVMIGQTTSFDTNDHPELIASITSKYRGDLVHKEYTGSSRPIYHRCQEMLDESHPRYAYFARLTEREAKAGLLSRPDIGTVGAWQRAGGSKGLVRRGTQQPPKHLNRDDVFHAIMQSARFHGDAEEADHEVGDLLQAIQIIVMRFVPEIPSRSLIAGRFLDEVVTLYLPGKHWPHNTTKTREQMYADLQERFEKEEARAGEVLPGLASNIFQLALLRLVEPGELVELMTAYGDEVGWHEDPREEGSKGIVRKARVDPLTGFCSICGKVPAGFDPKHPPVGWKFNRPRDPEDGPGQWEYEGRIIACSSCQAQMDEQERAWERAFPGSKGIVRRANPTPLRFRVVEVRKYKLDPTFGEKTDRMYVVYDTLMGGAVRNYVGKIGAWWDPKDANRFCVEYEHSIETPGPQDPTEDLLPGAKLRNAWYDLEVAKSRGSKGVVRRGPLPAPLPDPTVGTFWTMAAIRKANLDYHQGDRKLWFFARGKKQFHKDEEFAGPYRGRYFAVRNSNGWHIWRVEDSGACKPLGRPRDILPFGDQELSKADVRNAIEAHANDIQWKAREATR